MGYMGHQAGASSSANVFNKKAGMPSGPVAFLLHTCWKTLVTTSTSISSLSALLRGDQIEVFKILNGYENIDRNTFFSLKKDSRTRGHEVKLVKDHCRLDIRKHSFSQRTINEWNKLSTDCVTASSVNMFKNKVDTYLRRAGYK